MPEITISIVINNYNYARFVKASIDSALSQTWGNCEVIVIDDGSTDKSVEIILSYGNRIKHVLKGNEGQGSAYNTGFRVSTGDIVVFLDADDIVLPTLASRLIKSWRPQIALWQWYLAVIDDNGKLVTSGMTKNPPALDSENPVSKLLDEGWYAHPPGSGNAYARWALEKILPMPEASYRHWADLHLLYSLPFAGEREVLPEVLGQYRRHAGNHSARSSRYSSTRLQHRVETHRRRTAVISQFAPQFGYQPLNHLASRAAFAVIDRLLIAIKLPDELPLSHHEQRRLACEGLAAVWRHPRRSLFKNLVYTALLLLLPFLGMIQLPRIYARRIVHPS